MSVTSSIGARNRGRGPKSMLPIFMLSSFHYSRRFIVGLKHLRYAADAGDQRVDFFLCIVQGKRGTDGAADTQAVHQGLSTMVTGAYGNA